MEGRPGRPRNARRALRLQAACGPAGDSGGAEQVSFWSKTPESGRAQRRRGGVRTAIDRANDSDGVSSRRGLWRVHGMRRHAVLRGLAMPRGRMRRRSHMGNLHARNQDGPEPIAGIGAFVRPVLFPPIVSLADRCPCSTLAQVLTGGPQRTPVRRGGESDAGAINEAAQTY
jgi:hypothetical protein